MTSPIVPRDQVARHLDVSPTLLMRYEARGLVRAVREGSVEGYEPAEIRRLWSILTLHRDLRINLAGVEAILKLRDHMDGLHHRLSTFAQEMREALEADTTPDVDA